MKNILLVGKLNDMLKDMNKYLSRYFQVQLSSDNVEVISGMLKVVEPDLIVLSLIGMYDNQSSVFQWFQLNTRQTPVLTIGTQGEMEKFLKYYDNDQFENLIRPVNNRKVYETVCAKLGIAPEGEDFAGREDVPADDRKKILVVDDNGPTLRTIKGMLEDTYQVSLAPSGMKAMTSIGKSRPDLILLDYEMPVCDGRQTLEMIRADEELTSIPVIFLTGVNERSQIEPILALRPAGYLLKPPVKEKILETIEKVLQESWEKKPNN